jgi:hypothetical protein
MTSYHRVALGLAVALPLAFAGGHAFAFSYTDGPPGYSTGNDFADPDSQFDAMSDHMNQMYGTDTTDYSEMLTGNGDGSQAGGSVAPAPVRMPNNLGSNR